MRASWVVGCDGAHSAVRKAAGIAFEGGSYPQTFALADLGVGGGLEEGCVHAFFGSQGTLFFFPLGDRTWRLQCMLEEPDGARAESPSPADFQTIVDSFADGTIRLRSPVWQSRFRVHQRQAESYRVGRVLLAGDAAHVHSPAGAQGMNTGIQDAWNLGWKLALVVRGQARPTLLDSYETERKPVGRKVLRLSDRPFRVATSERWPFRFARRRIVPVVAETASRLDALRGVVYRRLAQLDVRYRDGPLAEEGEPRPAKGPRAGDRLPDAAVECDGTITSLHRRLEAPRFHLLLCGPRSAWEHWESARERGRFGPLLEAHHLTSEPGPGLLVDVGGEASARLGMDDVAHYLVRPDHHVAYCGTGTNLTPMSRCLERWLHTGARAL